jgi:tripartite-type tricarboxylate transporter receptor subunit TctC
MKHLTSRRALGRTLAALAAVAMAPAGALAQGASAKPLTLLSPFAAGGPADPMLRLLAVRLQEMGGGRTVVVDSKPGANGAIATQYTINSPADGNTVMFQATGLIQNLAIAKTKPYDPFRDLRPVALIGRTAAILVVPSASPYKTLPDLAKAIKANPASFSFGSYGTGSVSHFYGEVLRSALGVEIPHVPFKGTGPLLTEMMAGRIPLAFVSASTAIDRSKDGTLRVLAVAAEKRVSVLPAVPTLAEVGYKGFEAEGWWGLFMRADTPKPVADKMVADMKKVLNEPDIAARVREQGVFPTDETPEQFAAAMKTEYQFWEALAKKFNITND